MTLQEVKEAVDQGLTVIFDEFWIVIKKKDDYFIKQNGNGNTLSITDATGDKFNAFTVGPNAGDKFIIQNI